MSPRELIPSIMAAPAGGLGAFDLFYGMQEGFTATVIVGGCLLVVALVTYTVIKASLTSE